MFGCIVAGRLIQTNLQQVDDTHAVFELPRAGTINHICVFLLGTVPFPDGYGATVHFHWPGKGFQLLGALTNDKPSAIFRLRGSYSNQSAITLAAFRGGGGMAIDSSAGEDEGDVTAVLGIAAEPLDVIQAQLAASGIGLGVASGAAGGLRSSETGVGTLVAPPLDASVLAERIVRHLFNYLSGFASSSGIGGITPDNVVSLGAVQRWYESFLAKLRAGGPGFLERVE